MADLSRRRLFLAAASLPFSAMAGAPSWDAGYDVIVVGSGLAGLSAAIEAKTTGAGVLLIEKMGSLGGNSAICTGDMAVAGSPVQLRLGISDSPELMASDLRKAGISNDPERCRILGENSLPAWLWTVETLGVEWNRDALQYDEGQSVPRGVMSSPRSGSTIVSGAVNCAEKLKVRIRPNCAMTGIIRAPGPGGRALGIEVRDGFRFPDKESGTVRRIAARRGIVLAFGGFGADTGFRRELDPRLGDTVQTTNQPGATAGALRAAMRAGCAVRDLEKIQVLSWISSDETGIGHAWTFIEHVTAPFGIWVSDDGRRFTSELGTQKSRSDALLEVLARRRRIFGIITQDGIDQPLTPGSGQRNWEELLRRGIIHRYPALDDLADDYGIDASALRETVDAFNRHIRGEGPADPFGHPRRPGLPLERGPWYLVQISPKVHHCMGGLAVTAEGAVLDVSGAVIPGLYAAGEAAAGTFGESRIPSHSTADAIVFGRIAGRKAAAGPAAP